MNHSYYRNLILKRQENSKTMTKTSKDLDKEIEALRQAAAKPLEKAAEKYKAQQSNHFQESGMIIDLIVHIGVGVALGYGLDKILPTRPWLTILFMLFGIISGFFSIARQSDNMSKAQDDKKSVAIPDKKR